MIKFFNAGAGSGKTFALSKELADFLLERNGHPSQVILTTFSKKSAEELKERVRINLLEKGHPEKAAEMSNAMIGTVNAVCSQLVEKYAFEMGLSPELRVVDEVSTNIFFDEFINNSVDPDVFKKLARACARFNVFEGKEGLANWKDTLKPSWPGIVKKLASRFRSYNFNEKDVERSKAEALKVAAAFLLTQKGFSIKDIWKKIEKTASRTPELPLAKMDEAVLESLDKLRRNSANKERTDWSMFAKAGGALSQKTSKNIPWLNDLVTQCGEYHRTIEFAAEYSEFITLLYDTAYSLIDGYQEYKQERGLIDFADQELLFLQMLQENKTVQKEIGSMFTLVMVDEFQDSSPVQLAIFYELKKLVENSVWVGDPKQAIYGFRDSDPALFTRTLAAVEKENPANIQRLGHSYRSRPGIVEAVNGSFTGIFKGLLKKEHITLSPSEKIVQNEKRKGGFDAPALQVQFYNDTRLENYFSSIALQVKKVLTSGLKVYDKKENSFRKIRGGDIALLFRANGVVADCAWTFRQHGIPVSCEADGLQEQAEILWIRCLLRLVINAGDPLAIAQLAVLEASFDNVEDMLKARLTYLKTSPIEKPWKESSPTASIIASQTKFIALMPLVQAVRHLITASNLSLYCVRWGNSKQRFANINKVIELSNGYQEQCNIAGLAASFPGFLDHLCNCFDLPPVISEDAVTLMTVHKAKGLEWPMVYLVKLDIGNDDSRVFFNSIHVVQPAAPKKDKLLQGQTIIYLPWPFAGTQKLERVSDALLEKRDNLDKYLNAHSKSKQEEDRLLYVAFTRARDYLVLPHYKKSSGCGIESDARFQPSTLFTAAHWEQMKGSAKDIPGTIAIDGHKIQTQAFPPYDDSVVNEPLVAAKPIYYSFKENIQPSIYGRRFITPSRLEINPELVSVKVLPFDQPMLPLNKLSDKLYATIGNAIHHAYASWNPSIDAKERISALDKLLKRMGLTSNLLPVDLDGSFNYFHRFITANYAPLQLYKEISLTKVEDNNGTITTGVADLVLETGNGLVLIDHKTFPGHFDTMALNNGHDHYAGRYASQLGHYKSILEKATGKKVVSTLLHYIVQGKMVEVFTESESLC